MVRYMVAISLISNYNINTKTMKISNNNKTALLILLIGVIFLINLCSISLLAMNGFWLKNTITDIPIEVIVYISLISFCTIILMLLTINFNKK